MGIRDREEGQQFTPLHQRRKETGKREAVSESRLSVKAFQSP